VSASHGIGWHGLAGSAGFFVLVLFAVSFADRQLLCWRRSSGEWRQQLKWLVSGAAFSVLSVAASIVVGSAPGIRQVVSNILGFGLVTIPLAIRIGILKYRLYDHFCRIAAIFWRMRGEVR
jgi:hypothetical protein